MDTKDIIKGVINEEPVKVKEAITDVLKKKISDKFKETCNKGK
jgi:hypothetical protein